MPYAETYVTPKPAGWTPMASATKQTELAASRKTAAGMSRSLKRRRKLNAATLRPQL